MTKVLNIITIILIIGDIMATTIAVSEDIRDRIKEIGNKGETYDEIIERLLNIFREKQIHELLMDTKGTITIKEARKRLNK